MIKIVCRKCAKLTGRDDFYQVCGLSINPLNCGDCCKTIVKDEVCYVEINGETKEPYKNVIKKYIKEIK